MVTAVMRATIRVRRSPGRRRFRPNEWSCSHAAVLVSCIAFHHPANQLAVYRSAWRYGRRNLAAVVVGPLAISNGEAPVDKNVNGSRRVLARLFDRTATLDSLPVGYSELRSGFAAYCSGFENAHLCRSAFSGAQDISRTVLMM